MGSGWGRRTGRVVRGLLILLPYSAFSCHLSPPMSTVYFFTATPRPLRFFALGYVSRGASDCGFLFYIACPLIQRTNHRR